MGTHKYKAPRMIQARHITFNIEYGRYIKPLEHFITKKHWNKTNFGKGDYDELGSRIHKLARKYKYYTECDHSTFGAHVTKEHLRLTHKFYQSCYRHDATLRKLSAKTLRNNCISRQGDKYKVKGTRMSGDVDTSFGNSLINYAILKQLLVELSLDGDVIVNGDDSIIFSNSPIQISRAIEILRTYNMETEIKSSVTNIHDVEFCRCKVILNDLGKYTMMINPKRLEDIYGMTYRQVNSYVSYLVETAFCVAAINKANPVGNIWLNCTKKIINTIKEKKTIKYGKCGGR